MNRISLMLGASALLVGYPVVLPQSVQAAPATPSLELCRTIILPTTPEANLGECMSFNRSSAEGFHTQFCLAYEELEPEAFYAEFDSYSECVRAEHALPN
jgi:hypothetical protein